MPKKTGADNTLPEPISSQTEVKKSRRMVRILMILKEHSSRDNRLTQKDINRYLAEETVGPIGTAKTLSHTIHDLIEAVNPAKMTPQNEDSHIIKYRRSHNGMITDLYYDPPVKPEEAELLADGITRLGLDKETEARIIGKLAGEYRFDPDRFVPVSSHTHLNRELVNRNVAVLRKAISGGKKVSFIFNRPDVTGQLVPARKQRYTVSPYSIEEYRGCICLVANIAPAKNCSVYRADLMTDIFIKYEPAVPQSELDSIGDMEMFLAKQTGAAYGTSFTVTLKVPAWRYAALRDIFGDRLKLVRHIDTSFDAVTLTAAESEILGLVFTPGETVEVISPARFRSLIAEKAQEIADRYSGRTE